VVLASLNLLKKGSEEPLKGKVLPLEFHDLGGWFSEPGFLEWR